MSESAIQSGFDLRHRAEGLAAGLPPLLAAAEHLAAALQQGLHGRRRAGQGTEFWQYRAAQPGDEARRIDWRRSARSDAQFLREQEWQAAQSVQVWADGAASMSYRSSERWEDKGNRARLLALALAVLLERGGERIGLADGMAPPRAGRAQLMRMAEALSLRDEGADYGAPRASALLPGARAVFLSDFLGGFDPVRDAVLAAADKGVKGALVQVLDPAEEEFPFAGRAVFESMGAALRHETKEAAGLRVRYLARLAERRDQLADLGRSAGWAVTVHRTSTPAQGALLWLYQVIGPDQGQRR